jgi:hypothetical protein
VPYGFATAEIKQICGCKPQFCTLKKLESCGDFHEVLGSFMPTRSVGVKDTLSVLKAAMDDGFYLPWALKTALEKKVGT